MYVLIANIPRGIELSCVGDKKKKQFQVCLLCASFVLVKLRIKSQWRCSTNEILLLDTL